MMEFNIYCDESCHLENDKQKAMVLGAIWTQKNFTKNLFQEIRKIKQKHNLSTAFEIKWNKVSPAKIDLYLDLIKYFFENENLNFRVLIVPDKTLLDHKSRNQTHDEFYYKMYFDLLKVIFDPKNSYNIYLDIKDTRSQDKVQKLEEVLRSNHYDYSKDIIKKVQQIRSHEVELIQLADFLIGALSYLHRGLNKSAAKTKIIEEIKSRTGYSLLQNTLLKENKFNIFVWQGAERNNYNA